MVNVPCFEMPTAFAALACYGLFLGHMFFCILIRVYLRILDGTDAHPSSSVAIYYLENKCTCKNVFRKALLFAICVFLLVLVAGHAFLPFFFLFPLTVFTAFWSVQRRYILWHVCTGLLAMMSVVFLTFSLPSPIALAGDGTEHTHMKLFCYSDPQLLGRGLGVLVALASVLCMATYLHATLDRQVWLVHVLTNSFWVLLLWCWQRLCGTVWLLVTTTTTTTQSAIAIHGSIAFSIGVLLCVTILAALRHVPKRDKIRTSSVGILARIVMVLLLAGFVDQSLSQLDTAQMITLSISYLLAIIVFLMKATRTPLRSQSHNPSERIHEDVGNSAWFRIWAVSF